MRLLRTLFRIFYLTSLFLGLTLPVFGHVMAAPVPQTGNNGENELVVVLSFKGAVTPVLLRYIQDGIDTAVANNAQAVILQLDTPGGSVDVTKKINQ